MLTAEPTGGVVWHANRGAITLRVTSGDREAHVGQAHLGVNAFEQMVRVAEPLTRLARELLEERTAFPMESEAARGSMLVVGGAGGRRRELQRRARDRRGSRSTAASTRRRSSTRSSRD